MKNAICTAQQQAKSVVTGCILQPKNVFAAGSLQRTPNGFKGAALRRDDKGEGMGWVKRGLRRIEVREGRRGSFARPLLRSFCCLW